MSAVVGRYPPYETYKTSRRRPPSKRAAKDLTESRLRDSSRKNVRVTSVLALISSRFYEPWSLELFAQNVNVSSSRLSHLFQVHEQTPPMAALKVRRMEWAAVLLRSTHLSVKEVAAGVGILDVCHFVTDFQDIYGLTPAVYRDHKIARMANG